MSPVPITPIRVGHIDDVQELRRSKPMKIPTRFVRDMDERPTLETVALPPPCAVPVVDLSKLMSGKKDMSNAEISQLGAACQEWGFFQVQMEIIFSPSLAIER